MCQSRTAPPHRLLKIESNKQYLPLSIQMMAYMCFLIRSMWSSMFVEPDGQKLQLNNYGLYLRRMRMFILIFCAHLFGVQNGDMKSTGVL